MVEKVISDRGNEQKQSLRTNVPNSLPEVSSSVKTEWQKGMMVPRDTRFQRHRQRQCFSVRKEDFKLFFKGSLQAKQTAQ